jgi:predicted GNAT superfamily acetyltransferase
MILVREARGLEELAACVALQIEVWAYEIEDLIPRRMFLLAQKIGGQVFGAFDTSLPGTSPEGEAANMIGFAMALPGIRNGLSYLHSQMLAVRPNYRNQGLGKRLKLAQRKDALERGILLMEWTFDPLEIKNSFLNIHKLGAVVRRYTPNFYGVSSSRLQGGLPTDRLHAEWWMDTPRVQQAINGEPVPVSDVIETITVPGAIYEWKNSTEHHQKACAVQSENRQRFQQAFAQGLTVVGFTRDTAGNGIFQLGTWREPGSISEARSDSHED